MRTYDLSNRVCLTANFFGAQLFHEVESDNPSKERKRVGNGLTPATRSPKESHLTQRGFDQQFITNHRTKTARDK